MIFISGIEKVVAISIFVIKEVVAISISDTKVCWIEEVTKKKKRPWGFLLL